MHFRNLDLNLLVAFDVLLAERNVTRAGDRLGRTQPAMSGVLAKLRQYFDDDLLIRVGNTIELTPMAEGLVLPIKEFLSAAQQITEFKPSLDLRDLEQTFVITMSDYMVSFVLPDLIAALKEEAPKVRLRVRTPDYNYVGALDRRETDFIVVPPDTISGTYTYEEVLREQWVCIADENHYSGRDRLTFEEFLSARFVTANFHDGRMPTNYDKQFSNAGISRDIAITVPYFQLLPSLIVGTDMLAVIHAKSADRYGPPLGLKTFEIPVPLDPLVLELIWHDRNNHSRSHLWFKDLFHRVCATI